MKRAWQWAMAAVVLMCLVGGAMGQPLADRVPAGAIVYVGWAGSSELGGEYEQSHLKALMDDSGLRELFGTAIGNAIEKAPEAEAREALGLIREVAGVVFKHPTALYVTHEGPIDQPPGVMIICDAGADAERLKGRLQPIIVGAVDDGAPVAMDEVDGLVTVGFLFPSKPVGEKAGSLAADARMSQTMKRTGVQPTIGLYIDGTKLLSLIDRLAERDGNVERWRTAREGLGLDGLKSLAWAGGFSGRDWVNGLYIEAPAPRKGIAKLLDADKPLSEAAMKLVPRTAATAGGGRLDLAGLYDTVLAGVKKIEPRMAEQVEGMNAQMTEQLGFDIRNDLLGGLGDEWLWYTDARVAGAGPMGTVVVNPLRNPKAAREAIGKAVMMINGIIASQTAGEEVKLEIRRKTVDGVEMHYFATPLISPALAFHEGRMYLGLFPASVAGAVAHESADGSILDNPDFKRRLEQSGARHVAAFEYIDVEQVVDRGYPMLMMAGRTVAGFADMTGADAPARVMPKLSTLQEHAGPAASFAWSDETGYYARGRSFAPGASVLGGVASSDIMMMQVAGLGAGILMPAIERARELAKRTKSAANLKTITMGAIMYAHDHNGKLPDDLGELMAGGYIDSAEVFLHPDSPVEPPAHADKAELAKWVVNNTDYVYLGKGRSTDRLSWRHVLIHERTKADWSRESINIGFEDGHVKSYERAVGLKIIEAGKIER